jgi:hypothetical protein
MACSVMAISLFPEITARTILRGAERAEVEIPAILRPS